MGFFKLFIIFIVFYIIFHWIIKKIDFHNKLLSKYGKSKYYRFTCIVLLIVFMYLLEYGKLLLDDRYGHPNCISLIIGAFIGAICINFGPVIFGRSK